MADIIYKKFSELTQTTALVNNDLFPIAQYITGTSYNSKAITFQTLYNQTSGVLITPFTTTIQTAVNATLSSDKWNSTYSNVQSNSASWGAAATNALTAFSQGNTTTPQVVRFLSAGTTANASVAFIATGTGATLAQLPDNGIGGGNARGQYATDWQKIRSDATQVASGDYSVIGGGRSNIATGTYSFIGGGSALAVTGAYSTAVGGARLSASGQYSTVGGGILNTANNDYAIVAGGAVNIASGQYSAICGGTTNTITSAGLRAVIAGGNSNTASNQSAAIGGGSNNTASGMNSVVNGGNLNNASGLNSTVLGGRQNDSVGIYSTTLGFRASATNYGELAHATGSIVQQGDTKSSTFILKTLTNSSVLVSGSAVCYLDGTLGGYEITLPNNSTYAFTTTIIGVSSHTDSSGIHSIIRGVAKCNSSGIITLYGVSQVGTIYKIPNIGTFNAGMSATGNILRVVVATPQTGNTYWTARVQAEFLQF